MQLTEDSFRALARSSPWRFSALHFTRRTPSGDVEAWLRRPGWLRVVDAQGRETIAEGVPYTRSLFGASSVGVASSSPPHLPAPPQRVEPTRRGDGLVAGRPTDPWIEYDDPMYEDFTWVAMLDPVELATGTRIATLADGELFGRPVWRGRLAAVDGYDPRCSCCALLWGEVSDTLEYDAPAPDADYPSAYDVALDVETGILVSKRAVDGRDDWLEVEIHEVEPPT